MLFLASASPRRRELLDLLGYRYSLLETDVPEHVMPGEAPEDYVRRVARAKAGAGFLQVASVPGAVVLGADTEVVLDGEVFGKPRDHDDAFAMLARLRGRTHEVLSAVCGMNAGREAETLVVSQVRFGDPDDATLHAYVRTGEAMGKAGAYAIQGRAAAFIAHLDGSHSAVMGLPLYETALLLRDFGLVAAGPG